MDDIILTGSSRSHIQTVTTKLNSEFALKQLGNLDYFLGIEVKHLSNGSLLLSQSKYIRDANTNENAQGMPTPMGSSIKLSKVRSYVVPDPIQFRYIVGHCIVQPSLAQRSLSQLIKSTSFSLNLLESTRRQ